MAEPLPVIPLPYQIPSGPNSSHAPIWDTLSIIVCIVAATLIAFVDVESVMGSGPVLALFGIVLLVAGLVKRKKLRAILGGLHCMVCALFVVMVNLWNWGPADADAPFLVMGVVHTLVTAGVVVVMWMRYNRRTVILVNGV